MSEQFEIFEEIAEQTSEAANPGTRERRTSGRFMTLSPAMLRAKVAREPKPAAAAPDSPAASPSPPDIVPEKLRPAPGRVVYTRADLVAALRERKEALNLSHETLDGITGWADRYSAKVLAPMPRRGLSGETLQLVLDALALGVAAVVLVEDPEQTDRMRPRWTARGPSGPRPSRGALFGDGAPEMLPTTTENEHVETPRNPQAES